MCGISGVLGEGGAAQAAQRMSRALRHRGPDGHAAEAVADAGGSPCGVLNHERLAIIDPSPAGRQPMHTPDGRYTIVYNGEVYNYAALRDSLAAEGVEFAGHSDTEVLLLGWARHGRAFLERLRGMYAFAVWDRDTATAVLVRDPFGIKPLYVAQAGGTVLFGSEMRALLATELVGRRLSQPALRSYLATGSVAEPESIVEGLEMLPAGTLAEVRVRGGRARLMPPSRFGEALPPPPERLLRDPAEAAGTVREALLDSVRHHLVSDVPVALFLSGGIDSSALVGLAAEACGRGLDTFTVAFTERAYDEALIARKVAERFGTAHHEMVLTAADLLGELPGAFAAMDQPSMDGVNTFAISRAVQQAGIKVVLSGVGGDELFCGYPSFSRARAVAQVGRLPGGALRGAARLARRLGGIRGEQVALLLREASTPARAAYWASRTLFGGAQIGALAGCGGDPPLPMPYESHPLLQRVTRYEVEQYMRNTLLRDSDVFSMAHGLELRVPFVDRAVAAAAVAVDDSLKLRRGLSKPLLLSAVRDLLPNEVWDRPKRGFTLPFARWMRGELRDEVESVLHSPGVERLGLNPAAVRAVWNDFQQRRAGMNWSRPWALYTLVRWAGANGIEAAGGHVAEPELAHEAVG
ncbi:MAG TPA: asparagine synthase (glutamine-hydrolyzing) [Longimicrobiaceae bacterium]|jgi:asparagine synthase (glutamine-hydrolysing)|nr:asparagine synthase (glutamine-hydrolyzing) [Longimicrobiaceae bacterium]